MPTDTSIPRRKIALLGTFGTGNLGNECTLDAVLSAFSNFSAGRDILCICSGPEETRRKHRIPAFPIRRSLSLRRLFRMSPAVQTTPIETGRREITAGGPRRPAAVQRASRIVKLLLLLVEEPLRWYTAFVTLKNTDALMVIGLGMLGDFGIRPLGLHYDLLRWSLAAKFSRRSLFFVSVGVGPIRNPLSRLIVKTVLRLGDYRSYRDGFSRKYLQTIGFNCSNDKVYPDLVFGLPYSSPPSKGQGQDGFLVGFGIMNYFSRTGMMETEAVYKAYLAQISAAVAGLLERGCRVQLLIGDVAYDNGVRWDLRKFLEDRGHACDGQTLIDEPAGSVEHLLSQISRTDIVVASRFHNLLLGLLLSKPVVALSYHEKIVDLMNSVGLAEYCQDIEHINVEQLIAQCIELMTSRPAWQKQQRCIREQIGSFREALNEQYARIRELIELDHSQTPEFTGRVAKGVRGQ